MARRAPGHFPFHRPQPTGQRFGVIELQPHDPVQVMDERRMQRQDQRQDGLEFRRHDRQRVPGVVEVHVDHVHPGRCGDDIMLLAVMGNPERRATLVEHVVADVMPAGPLHDETQEYRMGLVHPPLQVDVMRERLHRHAELLEHLPVTRARPVVLGIAGRDHVNQRLFLVNIHQVTG